jgi:hypothetical protein
MTAEQLPKCVLGHPYNKENSEKTVLVHLLVQIIQLKLVFFPQDTKTLCAV